MVNPAINAAIIAAGQQQALSAKAVTDQLTRAGATHSRAAVPLDLSVKGTDKMLAHLVKRGHVRDAGGGRYWLDQEAVKQSTAAGLRVAIVLTLFMLSLAASLWALLQLR